MRPETHYSEDNFSSFGVLVGLSFTVELNPPSSKKMMESFLRSMAVKHTDRAGFGVLRIKTFLKSPAGHIRADLTGAKKEVFTELVMRNGVRKAELAVNIVAQGLSEEEAKAIVMEALKETLDPLNGRFSILRESI